VRSTIGAVPATVPDPFFSDQGHQFGVLFGCRLLRVSTNTTLALPTVVENGTGATASLDRLCQRYGSCGPVLPSVLELTRVIF
jgi:hypothetical protein